MALPRRPYLLGLLPGTSNDWATQDGAEVGWWGNTERQRDIERERERDTEEIADSWGKKQEGRKRKEHIMRSHAQEPNNFNQQQAEEVRA